MWEIERYSYNILLPMAEGSLIDLIENDIGYCRLDLYRINMYLSDQQKQDIKKVVNQYNNDHDKLIEINKYLNNIIKGND